MNKNAIKSALAAMQTGILLEKSKDLLSTLGYRSELTLELSGTVHDFFEEFPPLNPNTKTEQEFRQHTESAQIIFQFTKDEIEDDPQQMTLLESNSFDKGNIKSFLFCAIELKDNNYSRTKYAEFTREINKRLFAPTVILFRAGDRPTVAFADRRPDKTDGDRDVLGQVTLIKDIRLNNPHRAHLDILSELSLEECVQWMNDNRKPKNFDGLLAAWLAKLRFFISLAIEQEPEQNAKNFGIKPLPNLETRFIAANTLIGLKAQGTLTSNKARDLEQALRDNREQHFHATTRQRKRACKIKDEELRTELAAELKHFGMPADDAEKIAQWDPYDQNATADWFDPKWMFGIADGFDVAIGNPPYIQLQKEGGRLGNLYQDKGFDTFARTGDIYCLFYKKANQLLKNNGHVCFITSNKWMRAGYGKKLRDYFVTLTQPIQLLDMGPDVFDATVDTNILLFQKTVSNVPDAFRGVSLGADFDKQTDNIAQYLSDNGAIMEMPIKGEPWAILSPTEINLKRKIEDVGKPLKDWDINIYRGIVTGCNEAFIIDEAKREELIAQDPKSVEIIKPLLRGRDIERYHAKQAGLYLLATGSDLDIPKRYPAIYEHLETIGEQIESGKIKVRGKGLFHRDDQGENWWNLRACAYYSEFDKEKIVYPETTHSANFFYDKGQFYLDKTCFMITGGDIKLLVGLLSSTLMTFTYKRYCSGDSARRKRISYQI